MEKIYVKHYILDTYNDNDGRVIRKMDLTEVVNNYELVISRVRNALLANDIDNPDRVITCSFRMLGDYRDNVFHRKELVEINLEALRNNIMDFPWEEWGWVQAFQPLVDVAGFTIVELDSEYRSFGPAPIEQVDYIQPCFRIYEGGSPDWDTYERFISGREEPLEEAVWSTVKPGNWFTNTLKSFKDNIPTLLAISTSTIAVVVMLKTSRDAQTIAANTAESSKEILRHIEESIDDAIDMPQVVRVEIGDDYETIGTGRRTW